MSATPATVSWGRAAASEDFLAIAFASASLRPVFAKILEIDRVLKLIMKGL